MHILIQFGNGRGIKGFASTCKQFVTRSDIVDLWMGDSPEKLVDRVYTHFSDDFMIAQMSAVKFYA